LDDLVATVEHRGGDLTATDQSKAEKLLEKRKALAKRIEEETDRSTRQGMLNEARRQAGLTAVSDASASMAVLSEPRTYGVGSPNSYYADLYYTNRSSHPSQEMALRRQDEWAHQVEVEIADDSQFGRRAAKQFREHFREAHGADWRAFLTEARSRGRVGLADKGTGMESRALTTGGGASASSSGGGIAAFVTPIFTESDYVPYREFGRSFANECTKRPLPDSGMAIYTPQVTSAAAVSTSYTEGSGVTESDPGQGYISAGLIIVAGEVTTSQAVLDRTGPNFEYDVVIWDQLSRDYTQKFDVYVLTQALTNATSQSYTGTFKVTATSNVGGLYGQVAQAKATIRTTAGTVLNPNRVIMDPVRWEALAGWADSTGRPIIVPNYAGQFNAVGAGSATGDVGVEGPTGYRFAGLPAITDHNIPTTGGTLNQDQVIVADTTQTWVYEGDQIHRVLPQTLGGNLQVIFQQYSYAAVIQRYTPAVVKINGSAMSPPSFTN
jgi:hypothetical protein